MFLYFFQSILSKSKSKDDGEKSSHSFDEKENEHVQGDQQKRRVRAWSAIFQSRIVFQVGRSPVGTVGTLLQRGPFAGLWTGKILKGLQYLGHWWFLKPVYFAFCNQQKIRCDREEKKERNSDN